ncbi:MAG: hypothetical protein Q9166_004542 [cf. Caloplaca sp. 2 TL-2023]
MPEAITELDEISGPETELYLRVLCLATDVNELRQSLDNSKTKYDVLERKYSDAISENELLRRTNSDLESQNSNLEGQNRNLYKKLEQTRSKGDGLTMDLDKVNTDYTAFDGKFQGLVSENEAIRKIVGDLEDKARDLGSELHSTRAELGRVTTKLTECVAWNNDLGDSTETMRLERDVAVQRLDSSKADNTVLTQQVKSQRRRAEVSKKAHEDEKEGAQRLREEITRLKSADRDTKIRHDEEKEEMKVKLRKLSKELEGIKSKMSVNQPAKSATKKNLETENATLKDSLAQAKQENEGLVEVNKIEQVKKASENEAAANEDRAYLQAELDPVKEDLKKVKKEEQIFWTAEHESYIARVHAQCQAAEEAKTISNLELEKAKEGVDELIKQLEALTTASASGQIAKAASSTTSNNLAQADPQQLQQQLTNTINSYENKLAAINAMQRAQSVELFRLKSGPNAMIPHQPLLPGQRPHAPPSSPPYPNRGHTNPSINIGGYPGAPHNTKGPPVRAGGGISMFNRVPHPRLYPSGRPVTPLNPGAGQSGTASRTNVPSFGPGVVTWGSNPGFQACPNGSHPVPPIPAAGHQGTSFNPNAPAFAPSG